MSVELLRLRRGTSEQNSRAIESKVRTLMTSFTELDLHYEAERPSRTNIVLVPTYDELRPLSPPAHRRRLCARRCARAGGRRGGVARTDEAAGSCARRRPARTGGRLQRAHLAVKYGRVPSSSVIVLVSRVASSL